MERTPDAFADALATGETDLVNEAIDEVGEMDPFDVVDVYDECFEQCRPIFKRGDGYTRQSVVRFLSEAYPMLELKLAGGTEEERDAVQLEQIEQQRHHYVEFLLNALEDDDGRVRKAAIKGVETVASAMSLAGFDDERQALLTEIDELEAKHSDGMRDHIEEARDTVQRTSGIGPLL